MSEPNATSDRAGAYKSQRHAARVGGWADPDSLD